MKKVYAFFGFVGLLAVGVIGYQNCGTRKATGPAEENQASKETVVGKASGVYKLSHDPQLEMITPNAPLLAVDMRQGAMELRTQLSTTAVKTCAIDADRLGQLKTILDNAKLCEPGPLPSGMMVCMALALTDIQLESAEGIIKLRKEVCHNGLFLCDGQDEKLRALIKSLVEAPPSGCS